MSSQGVGSTGAYAAVSIGTSTAPAGLIKGGNTTRKAIAIENIHASQDLYVGTDNAVLTTTGLKVVAGQTLILDEYNGPVYGVGSGAATTVRYLEIS